MPVYERLEGGQVVERVDPVPGGYEDTRLGVAALEGTNGWRVAGADAEPAAEPTPTPQDPGTGADSGQAAATAPPTGRKRRT